jgi:hypothetical protein
MTRDQALANLQDAIASGADEDVIKGHFDRLRAEHPDTARELLLRLALPGFEFTPED